MLDTITTNISWTLGIIVFLALIVILLFFIDYGLWGLPPAIICEKCPEVPTGEVPYTVFLMRFAKWRRLFELDPTSFSFVSNQGTKKNENMVTENDYTDAHPCFYNSETNEFFLVKFGFADYVRYCFYERKIKEKISSLAEQKMSLAIVGDIRAKLDEIVEEANQNIKDTLNLQQEILLRLPGEGEGDKEEG